MTTILELLLAFIAILAIVIVAFKLGNKWQQLPHFVYNIMPGKLTAWCSVSDFYKAPLETFQVASGEIRKFRRVPDTVCYNVADARYVPGPCVPSVYLFIPGMSEAFMSFPEQEKFFMKPIAHLNMFVEDSRKKNRRADLRLWWADWSRDHEGGLLATGTLSVLMILCLLVGLAFVWSKKASGPYVDRTHYQIAVSNLNNSLAVPDKNAVYTTDEAPITLQNCTLKKVSVQRNGENFRYTAFVEPDQANKITKKGQRVKLYELQYYYSSTGAPQSLILARVE